MSATLSNQIGLNTVGATSVSYDRTITAIPQGFIPTQIANCALWLDGADVNTYVFSSGNNIRTWADKSGLGNHASGSTNFTSSVAPTLGTLNGIPAPSFTFGTNNTNSAFFLGNFATANTGTQMQSFAVVYMNSTSAGYARVLGLARPSTDDFNLNDTCFAFIRNFDIPGDIMVGRNFNYLSVPFPAFSQTFLVQSSQNGSNEYIGVNGTLTPSSKSTGISSAFNITAYAVGVNPNTTDLGSFFSGFIAEVIYYTTTLTTAQIQQVEGYLAWKWGIQSLLPSGHPYKNININGTVLPTLPVSVLPIIGTKTWSPLLLSGGAALWLDGSDVTSMSFSGTTITQWRDKSGNGRNATGYQTPTLASINKLPAVSLGSLNNFDGSISNGGNFVTVFAVATADGSFQANPFNRIVSLANVGTVGVDAFTDAWAVPLCLGGALNTMGAQRGVGSSIQAGAASISYNNPFLVCNTITTTTFNMYFNGSPYMTYTNGSSWGSLTYINYAIGRAIQYTGGVNYNGTNPSFVWPGIVCEVIISNTNMSDDERQKTEGYLAWKWGIQRSLPPTHPYYYFPPPPS